MGHVVGMLSLLLLLLSSSLSCLCCLPIPAEAEIPVQPDFDLKRLSGLWFPVSAVEKTGSLQHFSDPPMVVHAGRSGRMVWRVDLPINEWKCRREKYRMPQMERPGIYGLEGVLVRHVVETDYGGYFILHRAYSNVRVLKLYARERSPSERIRAKFKARATSLGFPADKIHPMIFIEPCPGTEIASLIQRGFAPETLESRPGRCNE